MLREVIVITSKDGLHARPVADFVRQASIEGHTVRVSRPGLEAVRGDSILAILSLGLKAGERVSIEVSGPDELGLIQRLKSIVSTLESE